MDDKILNSEKFEVLCLNLIKKYDKNVFRLQKETTIELFKMVKDSNNKYLQETNPGKISLGKFYLIKYNYNGNKIWCPIFTIEYRLYNNKNILYAINLDYLDYKFKIMLFNKIFYAAKDTMDKNQRTGSAKHESPIKGVNFDNIYKILKSNGNNEFSITAFDMEKIVKTFVVSFGLVHRFIFLRTKMVNSAEMEEQIIKEEDLEKKKKLEGIVEMLEKLDKEYSQELQEYYKKLKQIESKYKLTENS